MDIDFAWLSFCEIVICIRQKYVLTKSLWQHTFAKYQFHKVMRICVYLYMCVLHGLRQCKGKKICNYVVSVSAILIRLDFFYFLPDNFPTIFDDSNFWTLTCYHVLLDGFFSKKKLYLIHSLSLPFCMILFSRLVATTPNEHSQSFFSRHTKNYKKNIVKKKTK